ncbi:MAG: amidase [Gemmatimonadota bacterium]
MSASSDVALLPATELRDRIARRALSPVELVEACLDRIARYDGILNAVPTVSDRAIQEAREVERRLCAGEGAGLLCGLPVGIKDVTPVAGLRTTYGSPLYADYVPEEDALVVRRLRAAGAIVLGKTNTPEFAAGGHTWNEVFGPTRNPWDPALSAGGSSGGGAAALAAGMIALAEGTDLGGSLRIPASFCGVVGLRPAPGLVPTHPTAWVWDDLEVTGPLARTAEDAALMLQAISGPSPVSPLCQPVEGRDFLGAVRSATWSGKRLAYAPDVAGIGVDPAIQLVCRDAAVECENNGARVEEIELDLSFGREAFLALRGVWMVIHQHARLDRLDRLGVNVRANVLAGLEVTAEQLGSAERARGRIWGMFRDLFQEFDAVLTPCMAISPFPVEQNYPETIAGRRMESYVEWIAPTFVLSLAGLPVASVPCGVDSAGLPVGLQIVGPPLGEESVLALAALIEEALPIGLPRVPSLEDPE